MKRFYKLVVSVFILLYVILPFGRVYASEEATYSDTAHHIEQIIEYKIRNENVSSVQELLDSVFSKKPGNGITETYCLSLRGYYKDLNYSAYINKLTQSLKDEENWSSIQPQVIQKHALVYTALSKENPLLSYAKENTFGENGIMSYVYGLFLLKANEEKLMSQVGEELVHGLLSYQLEDGGFAYSDTAGDVDVTAFALQALAPYKGSDQKIDQSIEKAIQFLSESQLSDGYFESYGNAACESTAQVILALCALDIDYTSDKRFIKNSHTVKDGLLQFKLADGSFAHTVSGKSNDMATAQSLSALVALYRYETDQCFLYLYGQDGYDTYTVIGNGDSGISYKWILTGVILLLTVLYVSIFGRKNKKRLMTSIALAILLLFITWFITIESADHYYGKKDINDLTNPIKVTITIRCDTVAGKKDFIPKNGVLLPAQTLRVQEGDTVFDVLKQVTAEHKIQMEYKDASYIEGIGYLYEQDFGELSGWMYKVNGNFQSVGAGEYDLSEEDEIEWVYTCDLGKDVGDYYDE